MKKTKYSIIADTSVLNLTEYENFNYFQTQKILYELVSFIKNNKELEHIKILIPRMVVEELKKHQIDIYDRTVQKIHQLFLKFRDLHNCILQIPDIDYKTHLDAKVKSYLSMYKINVIEIPKKNLLPKLINKAINKEKPFYKTKEKDSGFKDAIIWESILEYANTHKDEKILFWNNDKDFFDENLFKEFSNATGNQIIHYNNPAEIKSFLAEEFKLQQKFSEVLSKINNDFYNKVQELFSKKYNCVELSDNEFYSILETEIYKEVEDINYDNQKNLYLLEIPFYITHKTHYYGWVSSFDEDMRELETDFINSSLIVTVNYNQEGLEILNIEPKIKNLHLIKQVT